MIPLLCLLVAVVPFGYAMYRMLTRLNEEDLEED